MQPTIIDLNLNDPIVEKPSAKHFFKPFGLVVLGGVGAGLLLGITSGPSEDLSKGDFIIIWTALIGIKSIPFGAFIGGMNLMHKHDKYKKAKRYQILNN